MSNNKKVVSARIVELPTILENLVGDQTCKWEVTFEGGKKKEYYATDSKDLGNRISRGDSIKK